MLNDRVEIYKSYFPIEYNLQFFADGPGGEKTEPATQKKLEDARNEGKVCKSRELVMALDLIILFICLKLFTSYISQGFVNVFNLVYGKIPDYVLYDAKSPEAKDFMVLFQQVIIDSLLILAPFLALGFGVTVVSNILQVGMKVTLKPLEPKLDKFNPINGFKRIISMNSLFELFKSIVKILLIGYIAYTSIRGNADDLFILYDIPLTQAVILCGNIIINTGLRISFFYLIFSFVDLFYQRHKFNEDMKMTKQEVKDEYKNTEGNPEIKSRQRQRMREASQRRMMQSVPEADVIITNPTHFAVALKYDLNIARAPVVVAKGQDYVAMKIKEIAKESGVEIVENKPLARQLFYTLDLGDEIPPELYQAVADILAVIYKSRKVS
ncbi:MAG: flagellar biosynthesis protein FlhB [Lachnospiraceae bacterium]|nr:flagellar biosynthesis protein FlhB [Lachnospiraceae bacterium]